MAKLNATMRKDVYEMAYLAELGLAPSDLPYGVVFDGQGYRFPNGCAIDSRNLVDPAYRRQVDYWTAVELYEEGAATKEARRLMERMGLADFDHAELRRTIEPSAALVPMRISRIVKAVLRSRGIEFSSMNPRAVRRCMREAGEGWLECIAEREDAYGWQRGDGVACGAITAFVERADLLELIAKIDESRPPAPGLIDNVPVEERLREMYTQQEIDEMFADDVAAADGRGIGRVGA